MYGYILMLSSKVKVNGKYLMLRFYINVYE